MWWESSREKEGSVRALISRVESSPKGGHLEKSSALPYNEMDIFWGC